MAFISNLASVSTKAKISSNNVVVGPFSTIYDKVEIGEGTWIGPNVTIMEGAIIGKNCKIFPGSVISAIPQDLKFKGETSFVVIGDNTTIRECATINRGTEASRFTKIGNNVLIMAYVHVAHDCEIGNHCILSNGTQLAGHVILEDYVIMGGMSGSLQKIKIGQHAFVSGTTFVSKNVPPFIKVLYTPGYFSGINTVGLLRRGFSREDINHIADVYKVIYNSDLNISQSIEKLEKEVSNSGYKDYIIDFVKNSTKGITSRPKININENYNSSID